MGKPYETPETLFQINSTINFNFVANQEYYFKFYIDRHMGQAMACLCQNEQDDVLKKAQESLLRREVRAEVMPPKRHLRRDDTLLVPEKSCLSANTMSTQYTILEELGKGTYGHVQKAQLKSDTTGKRLFAVKTIEKNRYQKEIKRFLREIEILKNLDHPNIIKFFEAYESKTTYYIVQEFLDGGDLGKVFEYQQVSVSENDAKDFMWQILLALNYLHQKGMAHRDIKPENFLMSSSQNNKIKLIDFGLSATVLSDNETIKETVGSPFYIAPEVLEREYTPLCDIWSSGIILFNFMTCRFPFDADHNDKVFELIRAGNYDKQAIDDCDYSPEAKDLLKKMLIREKDGRINADKALQHPWFESHRIKIKERGDRLVTKEMLEQIRQFGYNSLLQREMISLTIQEADFNDHRIQELMDAFQYIDTDFSGTISVKEIQAVYDKFGIKLNEGEIEDIVDSLYFKEKAMITYLQFIAATIDKEFYKDKQRIRELFNYIDVDLSGNIDYKDIQDCFKRFGRLLDDSKIKRMINECDVNKDERISFDEFYAIINAEKKRDKNPWQSQLVSDRKS